MHLFQGTIGQLKDGAASGIGGNGFGLRKTVLDMPENKKQVLGFHNQGIGVLEKNGGHARGIPLDGAVECNPVPRLETGINGMNPFLVKGNGQGIFLKQSVNVCANQVNVSYNFV